MIVDDAERPFNTVQGVKVVTSRIHYENYHVKKQD